MAQFSADDLADLRQRVAAERPEVDYTKAPINAAIQAVEDWYEANRPALSQAINAATTPLGYTFNGAQKQIIGKWWLQLKYRIGG